MNDFSLASMLKQGWPVLTILLVMSVFSAATFIDRLRALRRARCNAGQFVRYVIRVIEERGLDPAINYCAKHPVPIARAVLAVLEQNGDRESRERALDHSVEQDMLQLQAGVSALGTIASVAPFVGLLGTVIGIIKAFGSIAVSAGGGAEVVSAGIAEALVTTACGLLVAIPSVVFYNYCVHKVRNLAKETDLAVYELIAWLSGRKEPPVWTGSRTPPVNEPDLR
ncbi:MAG: MotA/TolQ/ExbB proton channel family protein [bacterium]